MLKDSTGGGSGRPGAGESGGLRARGGSGAAGVPPAEVHANYGFICTLQEASRGGC